MFRIIRYYGVPDNVYKEIPVLYIGTKSSVLVDGEMSGEFEIKKKILAHFLFITVLDWGFKMVPRWLQRYPAEKVSCFEFADDIVELEELLEKG